MESTGLRRKPCDVWCIELFKVMKQPEIAQEHVDRLQKFAKSWGVPKIRIIELDYELRYLSVNAYADRQYFTDSRTLF